MSRIFGREVRRPSVNKMLRLENTKPRDPIFAIHEIATKRWGDLEEAVDLARRHPEYMHIAKAWDEGDIGQALEWIAEAYQRAQFPEFQFYHATPDNTAYLTHAPHLLNVLVSQFRLCENDGRGGPIWRHLSLARTVFLDSGQISLLKRVVAGHADAESLRLRMSTQRNILDTAYRISLLGVRSGFAAMLDHPCEPAFLKKAKMSVREAVDLTISNAIEWLELMQELPKGFTPVFCIQGWTLDDYEYCVRAYEHYGILDQVRYGNAILAVGTTCMRKIKEKNGPGLFDVYRYVAQRIPYGRKHALGIGDEEALALMYHMGWINQGDSGTASTSVGFNDGNYRVEGHRYNFLVHAQYAAAMLDLGYRIQQRIHGGTLPDRLTVTFQPSLRLEEPAVAGVRFFGFGAHRLIS